MNECFKCGVTEDKRKLVDAISDKEIVKLCPECAREEGIPIIRRLSDSQIMEAERTVTYRKSLRSQARDSEELRHERERRTENLRKSEETLNTIIDRHIKLKNQKQEKSQVELIDNFHWTIVRTRRDKRMTQEEFARGINESVTVVRMLEQGTLPEDDYRLINKVEDFLKIKIKKDPNTGIPIKGREPIKVLDFKHDDVKTLTIEDLRRVKREREEERKRIEEQTRQEIEARTKEMKAERNDRMQRPYEEEKQKTEKRQVEVEVEED